MRATTSFTPKRLHDKVVGAQFKADDRIDLLGLGTDEDNGHVRIGAPDLPADVVTTRSGHHDVEADKVRRFLSEQLQGVLSILSGQHFVAFGLENLLKTGPGMMVIFGNENLHISDSLTNGVRSSRRKHAPTSEATALQIAPVRSCQLPRDRKADAGPCNTVRELVAEPVERLEYSVFLSFRNAGPAIADYDRSPVLLLLARHLQQPARSRVLLDVGEQIPENLFQGIVIELRSGVSSGTENDPNAFGLQGRLEVIEHELDTRDPRCPECYARSVCRSAFGQT